MSRGTLLIQRVRDNQIKIGQLYAVSDTVSQIFPAEEFYQIEHDDKETVFLYSLKNISFILNPRGRTSSRLLVSPGLRSELEDIS